MQTHEDEIISEPLAPTRMPQIVEIEEDDSDVEEVREPSLLEKLRALRAEYGSDVRLATEIDGRITQIEQMRLGHKRANARKRKARKVARASRKANR